MAFRRNPRPVATEENALLVDESRAFVSGDGDGGFRSARVATARVADSAEAEAPKTRRRFSLQTVRSLRTFDSLRNKNFRWYFLSMFGVFGAMNMQMVVKGFLVFQLTGSYAALGALGLANAMPGLGLSLVGGVIADRVPKKVVQQIGSSVNALNALSIAMLLVAGMLRWEYLLISSAFQGVVQGLMMPSRQSMLSDIVYPRHIMNAIALNNVGMNLSRMVMPAIGGLLLAVTDAYWVFFIMTAFYMFSVVTLFKVPAKPIEIPEEEKLYAAAQRARGGGMRGGGMRGGHGAVARKQRANGGFRWSDIAEGARDLKEGMRYIRHDRTLALLLIVNFLMVLCSMPYMQMLPGFVQQVLDGDAAMQGLLQSFAAIGSLASALVVASLPSRHRGKMLLAGGLLTGIALTAFSFSNIFWVTAPVMIFLGVGQQLRMVLSNALVQTYVEDEYRGRVMSIYMMEMNLVMLGAFFVSLMAQAVGVQYALGATSITLIVLCVVTYLFIPRLRNID
jgi:MFS family permease